MPDAGQSTATSKGSESGVSLSRNGTGDIAPSATRRIPRKGDYDNFMAIVVAGKSIKTTTYYLSKRKGLSVAPLDMHEVGSQTSPRAPVDAGARRPG